MATEFLNLTFEQVTNVTTNPIFIISLLIVWVITLSFYMGVGFIRFRQGKSHSTPLVNYFAYWLGFGVLFFVLPMLTLLFIIFPIWMKFLLVFLVCERRLE